MLALLFDLAWKSAVIAGLGLIATLAMRRRPAAERAALLLATLGALLALPLLAWWLPTLDLPWLPAPEAVPTALAPVEVAPIGVARADAAPVFGTGAMVMAAYGVGVALLLARFLIGLLTLGAWTRGARPALDPRWTAALEQGASGVRRPLRLLVSPHAETPLSWGLAPAWILIGPATHDCPEQAEAVIAHELAHVRRFDWIGLVVARLATAGFWFNPLAWLVARALSREVELAADADALRHVGRHDYAQALLAVAGGRLAHREALGMAFTRTALATRITATLNNAPSRARPLVQALLLAITLGAAAPIAAMQFVPVPPDPLMPRPPVPAAPAVPEAPLLAAERIAIGPVAATVADAKRPTTPQLPHTDVIADAQPSPATVSAPLPPPNVQVAGRTGGNILFGPKGITLTGATGAKVVTGRQGMMLKGAGGKVVALNSTRPADAEPDDDGRWDEEEARRGAEEARRGAEQGRLEAIKGKREGWLGAAVGLRAQADEIERQTRDPDHPQPPQVLVDNLLLARNLRAAAMNLENQAKNLTAN